MSDIIINSYISPIQELKNDLNNNQFFIKRDDLLPFSFGGNKFRISKEFILDMRRKKKTCMIGYGSCSSNLVRVLANMCATENIPCYMIISGNSKEDITINQKIAITCGAKMFFCDKSNVAETVEDVFNRCIQDGYDPYYINGNKYGKGNECTPINAYKKAYCEIIQQINTLDYIFLPVGTGMTQAGLIAGKLSKNGKEKIIGISVARSEENEKEIIKRSLSNYLQSNENTELDDNEIIIDDSFLFGGYGQYNEDIVDCINTSINQYGIFLDPVYTGKAFYGMLQYIKRNNIRNKKIMFIHTGGTPLYIDFLNKKIGDDKK